MLTGIFLVSGATLTFEVLLARVFSVSQGNHLSFLVISIALFGFAASGTFFSTSAPAVERWRSGHWSLASGVLFSASMLAAVTGLRQIPLDYHRLILEPVQAAYLLAAYLLLALPFFFSGGIVAAAYMAQPPAQRHDLLHVHGGLSRWSSLAPAASACLQRILSDGDRSPRTAGGSGDPPDR